MSTNLHKVDLVFDTVYNSTKLFFSRNRPNQGTCIKLSPPHYLLTFPVDSFYHEKCVVCAKIFLKLDLQLQSQPYLFLLSWKLFIWGDIWGVIAAPDQK